MHFVNFISGAASHMPCLQVVINMFPFRTGFNGEKQCNRHHRALVKVLSLFLQCCKRYAEAPSIWCDIATLRIVWKEPKHGCPPVDSDQLQVPGRRNLHLRRKRISARKESLHFSASHPF